MSRHDSFDSFSKRNQDQSSCSDHPYNPFGLPNGGVSNPTKPFGSPNSGGSNSSNLFAPPNGKEGNAINPFGSTHSKIGNQLQSNLEKGDATAVSSEMNGSRKEPEKKRKVGKIIG